MKVQAWALARILDPCIENAGLRSPERLVSTMKASWYTQHHDIMDWSIVAVSSRGDQWYQHTQKQLCVGTLTWWIYMYFFSRVQHCWSPPSHRHKCTQRRLQGPNPTEENRLCFIFPTMVPIVKCLHSCSMPMQEVSSSPERRSSTACSFEHISYQPGGGRKSLPLYLFIWGLRSEFKTCSRGITTQT